MLLVIVIAFVTVAGHLPAPTARLILHVGLILLIVAFGVHLAGHAVLDRLGFTADSWAEQIEGRDAEHGAEVAGWLLVALALALAPVTRRRPPPRTHR